MIDIQSIRLALSPLKENLGLSDLVASRISHSLMQGLNFAENISLIKVGSTELVITNQTQVTMDPSKPNLIVKSNNVTLSSIIIPSNVTSPVINYGLIQQPNGLVNVNTALTIQSNTTEGNVTISIPTDANLNGTNWNGIVNLPTIQPFDSIIIPAEANFESIPLLVVEIGSESTALTLDEAARIIFYDQAGKRIGYTHGPGALTEITQVCKDDTQIANDLLPVNGNCKIQVGKDLIVWTKHFTSFTIFYSLKIDGGPNGGNIPPQFNGPLFSTDNPITVNGTGFSLPSHSNEVETKTITTGKPFILKLLLWDNSGPDAIEHIGLYTNLRGNEREVQNSDTSIVYDKGSALQVHDPHGYLSNVDYTTNNKDGKLEFTLFITFTKSMEKSDLILRTWDSSRNSADVKILNLWQAVNSTIVQAQQNSTTIQNKPNVDAKASDLLTVIKEWGGYSSKSISDSELLDYMRINAKHIPSWFMKTTKWIVNNDITEQEFINAITYMYDHGIVR